MVKKAKKVTVKKKPVVKKKAVDKPVVKKPVVEKAKSPPLKKDAGYYSSRRKARGWM